jgi:hypothetical protein
MQTGDAAEAFEAAREESTFASFVYSGTAAESKITQLYGDSKAFDETSYHGKCDLIFIDGSHAYSYIESDTQKALKMIAPAVLFFGMITAAHGGHLMSFVTLTPLRRRLPLMAYHRHISCRLSGAVLLSFHFVRSPKASAKLAVALPRRNGLVGWHEAPTPLKL